MFRFEFIKACWFTPMKNERWGLPFFLNGDPGVAKSAALEAYAKMCGFRTKVLLGSLLDPTDLAGMPVPGKTLVKYLPAKWVHEINEAAGSFLFLDEFRGCTPEVQNAMLRVVLDGVVGDVELHKSCRIGAAANPVEQTSGGYDLSPPMNNRFTHLSWAGPTADQFRDYHIKGGSENVTAVLDPDEEQDRVMSQWPTAYAKATGLVTSLLSKNSALLVQKPHKDGSPAYATPRSWEHAMRIIASSDVHGLTAEESNQLLMGTIGAGPTQELIAFKELADLPDIEDLLDGKIKFEHDPARPDRTHVTFSSCGAMLSNTKCRNRVARANTLWGILKKVSVDRPDLCVVAAQPLIGVRDSGIDRKTKSAVIVNLKDMLEAADYSVSNS